MNAYWVWQARYETRPSGRKVRTRKAGHLRVEVLSWEVRTAGEVKGFPGLSAGILRVEDTPDETPVVLVVVVEHRSRYIRPQFVPLDEIDMGGPPGD